MWNHEEINLARGRGECGRIRGKLGTENQIIGSPKNHATETIVHLQMRLTKGNVLSKLIHDSA